MLSISFSLAESVNNSIIVNCDWNVWHRRLGHPHVSCRKKSLHDDTPLNINEIINLEKLID